MILIHKWLTNVAKQTAQTTDEIHYQFKQEALSFFVESLKNAIIFPLINMAAFQFFEPQVQLFLQDHNSYERGCAEPALMSALKTFIAFHCCSFAPKS